MQDKMRAMVLHFGAKILQLQTIEKPVAGINDVLIKVHTCGVCRTDLHMVDAELKNISFPIIPGHEIVGTVVARGASVRNFGIGDRVGVPWLSHTCGECTYCTTGQENLCDKARFTGCHVNGGYAEYIAVDSQYCFNIPAAYTDLDAAPLLCAGLIGYRALRIAGEAKHIGIYGFGSAAQIITQIARRQGRTVYGFTRPGDIEAQQLAYDCGAIWADSSDKEPPSELDAALLFAPVGELVPQALRHVHKGGAVICAGIHMSDIPAFPYSLLWGERSIHSVANLTRRDGHDFLRLATNTPLRVCIVPYPLSEANQALSDMRSGKLRGSAVLKIS